MRLRYAEAVPPVTAATSAPLVDCLCLVPADPRLLLADGYHPNEAGFELMSRLISEAIRQSRVLPDARRTNVVMPGHLATGTPRSTG